MFVVQFGKGKKRRFFDKDQKENFKGLPGRITIGAATTFGEAFRSDFSKSGNLQLKTINVSPVAEMMYEKAAIKVSKIYW